MSDPWVVIIHWIQVWLSLGEQKWRQFFPCFNLSAKKKKIVSQLWLGLSKSLMSPCLIIDRPFLSKPLLASEDARNLWLVEVVVNCPEDGYFTVLVPVFWLLIFPTPSDIMFTCLGEHGVSVLFGIEHLTYSFSTQTEYNPKPFFRHHISLKREVSTTNAENNNWL